MFWSFDSNTVGDQLWPGPWSGRFERHTWCGLEQELFVHCPKVEVCNCGIKRVEQKEYYSEDCWERWVQEEAADLR